MRIIIAESAISQAPVAWKLDRKITQYLNKYGRLPLIDASKHQHLLQQIPLEERLDRPDILHFGLLTVLGYCRFMDNIDVGFSTFGAYYSIDPSTKLPRSQSRFYGILEQLLSKSYKGKYISSADFPELSYENSVVFTPSGKQITNDDFKATNFIFGGFAHGDFKTSQLTNLKQVRLVDEPLELWTALSLFLNKYMQIHDY